MRSLPAVPVIAETGADGGYFLPKRYGDTPLILKNRELVALFQAALLTRESGHPNAEALQGALQKLSHGLSASQAQKIELHLQGMKVAPNTRSGPVAPLLRDLETAVTESVTVELGYVKLGAGAPEQRTVDPYGLIYQHGLWYLVGGTACVSQPVPRQPSISTRRAASTCRATF